MFSLILRTRIESLKHLKKLWLYILGPDWRSPQKCNKRHRGYFPCVGKSPFSILHECGKPRTSRNLLLSTTDWKQGLLEKIALLTPRILAKNKHNYVPFVSPHAIHCHKHWCPRCCLAFIARLSLFFVSGWASRVSRVFLVNVESVIFYFFSLFCSRSHIAWSIVEAYHWRLCACAFSQVVDENRDVTFFLIFQTK